MQREWPDTKGVEPVSRRRRRTCWVHVRVVFMIIHSERKTPWNHLVNTSQNKHICGYYWLRPVDLRNLTSDYTPVPCKTTFCVQSLPCYLLSICSEDFQLHAQRRGRKHFSSSTDRRSLGFAAKWPPSSLFFFSPGFLSRKQRVIIVIIIIIAQAPSICGVPGHHK